MYFSATAMSPCGLARKSNPGPFLPPASSNPLMPGGMKCVPGMPTNEPPRALMAAVRSNAARIALRTLMLSSGLIARVEREPAEATARERDELVLLALHDPLEHLRRRVGVEDQVLTREHLAAGHVGVGRVRGQRDLVEVRGTEVERLVPVRVANQVDRLAGLVADEVALGVVLDHVRAGGDDVLVVRRRVLLVELLGVLLRDRRRDRHDQERGEARALRLGQLERDLVRVVDDDAGDVLRARPASSGSPR